MTWVFALVAVTAGAVLQRITGLGFVLVAGPLLVLALDPFSGIVLANILSGVLALLVLSRTYGDANWRIVGSLLLGLVIGMPLGALLVRLLNPQHLLIAVGSLTLFAVLLVLFKRPLPFLAKRSGPFIAGAVSSFSTVTAAVGGPALAIYGAATAMPIRTFIPTVQAVSLVSSIVAIALKAPFELPLPLLFGALGCVAVGTLLGSLLRRFVPSHRAQLIALLLALVGALAATLRGIFELIA